MSVRRFTVGGIQIPVTHRGDLRFYSLAENWPTLGPILEARRAEFDVIVGECPPWTRPVPQISPAHWYIRPGCCRQFSAACACWLRDALPGNGWCLICGELHWGLASIRESLVFDPLQEIEGSTPSEAFSAAMWRSVRIPLSKCGDDPVALILRTESMTRAA